VDYSHEGIMWASLLQERVISSLADFKLFPVLQHIISIAVLAIFIGLLMIDDAGV
jgi:hypothetical protein